MRDQRAEADERAADDRQRGLRLQPLAHRAAEVDQQQHRERAERREGRDHRVADHLLADREQPRHHDRRAPGAAQRREVAVVLAQPAHGMGGRGRVHAGGCVRAAVRSCRRFPERQACRAPARGGHRGAERVDVVGAVVAAAVDEEGRRAGDAALVGAGDVFADPRRVLAAVQLVAASARRRARARVAYCSRSSSAARPGGRAACRASPRSGPGRRPPPRPRPRAARSGARR